MIPTAVLPSRSRLKMRLLRGVGTAVTAAVLTVSSATSSQAGTAPKDGPAAAHIVQTFYSNLPLRAGNSSFGEYHIAIGGSRRTPANHELTPYAKSLWQKAIDRGWITGRFPGSQTFSYQYTTPSGIRRTMCVIVDTNDYYYANVNYGEKGIITAYWMVGWDAIQTCNNTAD